MVQTDARYGSALWLFDVISRVQTAADTSLEDNVVTALTPELQHGQHSHDVEESDVQIQLVDFFYDSFEVFDYLLFGDHLSIDLNPLPECVNMR